MCWPFWIFRFSVARLSRWSLSINYSDSSGHLQGEAYVVKRNFDICCEIIGRLNFLIKNLAFLSKSHRF